ncbi:hypothetical protein [Glycomyces tritici]|uniref:Uncharacterized protein n=1 Tax=Glycomyces tritici TaxID=2665176 RepID=A0ABT7YPU6_9ACTN|nr:hypothetical protein [Glycomyces tritici]MDN3240641.1 hypothetical protein [Glycomyces tritici]
MSDFTDTGGPQQKAIENAGLESLGDGCVRRPEKNLEHFHGLPLVEPEAGPALVPR